jgi:hypothetical protein
MYINNKNNNYINNYIKTTTTRQKDDGTQEEYKHDHVRSKKPTSVENCVFLVSSCP